MRRWSVLTAVVAVLLLSSSGAALAEPPSRLAERVTDHAGVLAPGQTDHITQAIDRLRTDRRIDLFVVYVHSFDGADGQTWANRTAELSQLGTEAVIPSIARRTLPIPYDRQAYRRRNLIERMFGRLKDFRRIATRYDKLARNFLAAIVIAATLTWWI